MNRNALNPKSTGFHTIRMTITM